MVVAPITAPADDAPHLLVVDDDRRIRDLLSRLLMRDGFRVSSAENAAQARAKLKSLSFDLLILDVMMPGESGFDLARSIRTESSVPILMLSARSESEDRIQGLELGADDYVPKPFSPREVVARVQALLRRAGTPRGGGRGRQTLTSGDLALDPWSRRAAICNRSIALTPAEFRLLEALLLQPGRTLTRDALIARTCGPEYDGNDRTIDTHITNLRRKLETIGGIGAIATVHGVSYRLHGPDDDDV